MKSGIHPEYVECTVRCSCGNKMCIRDRSSSVCVESRRSRAKDLRIMAVKLISSDMDGTLLDENGQVPPETCLLYTSRCV